MASTNPYRERKKKELRNRYEELRRQLPGFAITWLNSKANLQWSSRVAYAFDIIRYLQYVIDSVEGVRVRDTQKLTLADISDDENPAATNRFNDDFFNAYASYLRECTSEGYSGNNLDSVERKLAPIRAIYQYYCNRGDIRINPLANFEHRKEPEDKIKNIKRLSADEVKALFSAVESAEGVEMSVQRMRFYQKTRQRDFAIIMLFLGTGIRVSELVGADLSAVDFKSHSLSVVRKGAHGDMVFFNEDVEDALRDYIEGERKVQDAKRKTPEDPLFYSLQGSRISVAAVEKIVEKYAKDIVSPSRKVTPHRLRASYGSRLYECSGDLGLVQDSLGHSSPSTTKRYYVDSKLENMKKAAKTIKY